MHIPKSIYALYTILYTTQALHHCIARMIILLVLKHITLGTFQQNSASQSSTSVSHNNNGSLHSLGSLLLEKFLFLVLPKGLFMDPTTNRSRVHGLFKGITKRAVAIALHSDLDVDILFLVCILRKNNIIA